MSAYDYSYTIPRRRGTNPNPYPSLDPYEGQAGVSGALSPDAVAQQTAGTYGPPMPPTTARGTGGLNPFTDVLDHVSQFTGAIGQTASAQSTTMAPSGPTGGMANAPATPGIGQPASSGGGQPYSATTAGTTTYDPATGQYIVSQSAEGPGGPEQRLPDPSAPGGTPPPSSTPAPPPSGGLPPLNPNTPEAGKTGTTPPPRGGRPGGSGGQNDWLHYDPSGKPWSNDNPPPKPAGTEDPAVAARWYSQFNYRDSSLVNVTAADVNSYRTSGYQGDFLDWWQHGKPTPAQTPPPGNTPPPLNPTFGGWIDPALSQTQQQHRPGQSGTGPATGANTRGATPPPAPPLPTEPPPPSNAGAQSGAAPPPGTQPPGATPPPATPPPSQSTSMDNITQLIDLFNSGKGPQAPPIEDQLNPIFARQRGLLADQMRADAAATGALHSGGFGESLGNALSNLSGQQSAALASQMGQEYLAKLQQNTQLTQLATQAGMQKYVADINDDLERFKVNSNDDLQRWLNDKNNALAKYGIDKNDLLQRYQAELQLKGVQYSADRSVDAAALHAAAAQAAAAASSAASQYAANVQLQLGQGNLQVQREKNIGDFLLGMFGLGMGGLNDISSIFAQFPTGGYFVKP